jgi:apolipoprotein N-acyltransferase
LLCTLTNDGWLGDTDWQQHHLYLGALRSIETRREMLHCSNMGASAVISAKGEILKEIPYNQRTALRFERVILQNEITFYTLYGDYIGRTALIVLTTWLLYMIFQKILRKNEPS